MSKFLACTTPNCSNVLIDPAPFIKAETAKCVQCFATSNKKANPKRTNVPAVTSQSIRVTSIINDTCDAVDIISLRKDLLISQLQTQLAEEKLRNSQLQQELSDAKIALAKSKEKSKFRKNPQALMTGNSTNNRVDNSAKKNQPGNFDKKNQQKSNKNQKPYTPKSTHLSATSGDDDKTREFKKLFDEAESPVKTEDNSELDGW